MAKLFDSVKMFAPKRNKFDLSHERKFSFNMGDLVPVLVNEVLPGDSFRVNTEVMLRLAPMLAPIMHRVNVKVDYFFVPNRLVWAEWEKFITAGKDGDEFPVHPIAYSDNMVNATATNWAQDGMLADYMGLPSMVAPGGDFISFGAPLSVLPFRAYQKIYDEYYRDQNLSDPVGCSDSSGDQAISPGAATEFPKLFTMRKRAWEKDYLTSALPFAQRGEALSLSVSGFGNVPLIAHPPGVSPGDSTTVSGTRNPGSIAVGMGVETTDDVDKVPAGDLYAKTEDLESLSVTIEELRRTSKLQEWLEAMARIGARYTEQLKGIWNVKPADARLQRPEFLGSGNAPVMISEVLQTVTGDTEPLGEMGGHGVSASRLAGFKHMFDEHGFVIGIMSVLPKTAYQQGLPKWSFSRLNREDYFWPQFAHLGEQEVKNYESFFNSTYDSTAPDNSLIPPGTFGYQSRYCEYKYQPSSVHGDFKTDLAFWHMGRIFEEQPVLNESFVMSDPTHRIFAVEDPDVHKLWCQVYHKFDALRPLPYWSTPRLS